MRILVNCEESGTLRRALRERGHDAWSCDLLPADDGSPHHYQCDALLVAYDVDQRWDAMVAFPPCTHFAGSGARWLTDHWVTAKRAPGGRYWHDGSIKRRQQAESLEFVRLLWAAPIPRKALENPRGMLSTLWRKPDQEVQPWQHGHGELKATGLWLDGLPKLVPTNIVAGREQKVWLMPPGPERAKLRSRTYPGIANAMADQWFGGAP